MEHWDLGFFIVCMLAVYGGWRISVSVLKVTAMRRGLLMEVVVYTKRFPTEIKIDAVVNGRGTREMLTSSIKVLEELIQSLDIKLKGVS